MKNKVINLFEMNKVTPNKGVKYSELFDQFLTPIAKEFTEFEFYEDIIVFTISAWNFGNMRAIIPKQTFKEIIVNAKHDGTDYKLLNKMIDYKVANFKEYSNFIIDYEVEEKNKEQVLTLITQEQDHYMEEMMQGFDDETAQDDFEENYINRSAIILKPLQPFIDWCTNFYHDVNYELDYSNTYLISEEIDDKEAWLKKKYDKLFKLELEAWQTNKKEWPQKRNYKMFKEWFRVDISIMIYDIVKEPIFKE